MASTISDTKNPCFIASCLSDRLQGAFILGSAKMGMLSSEEVNKRVLLDNERSSVGLIRRSAAVRKAKIAESPGLLAFRRMQSRISSVIKNKNKSEVMSPEIEMLGCSAGFLFGYLEAKFQPGMTWENHGVTGWHIDHIIPCAAFDLTDPGQQKKCLHYTNLQPLWAVDNIRKSDTLSWENPGSDGKHQKPQEIAWERSVDCWRSRKIESYKSERTRRLAYWLRELQLIVGRGKPIWISTHCAAEKMECWPMQVLRSFREISASGLICLVDKNNAGNAHHAARRRYCGQLEKDENGDAI